MRKLIAILTTLILILSLTACGGKKDKDKQESDVGTFSSESISSSVAQDSSSGDAASSDKSSSSSKPVSSKPTSSKPITSSSPAASSPSGSTTDTNDPSVYTITYKADAYDSLATTYYNDYWKMPFAREDDGTFTRDGYVLLGYSFNQNGSGQLIRPGYKYNLSTKASKQTLYCVWAKETNPANFKINQNGYITAYNGNDSVVYIPRKIGGKTVVGIASGAFANNKAITEVHITSSITTVEERAFASCSNLKAITLYDTVKKISNASFEGSPVKTVRMCAGKTPRYMESYETYGIKYERLINTKGQKRVIVVAGSSALYGIDTDYMQSLFKNGYTVVNFGTNGNMNIPFYLDAISPLLTSNDIVVFAPEQYGPYAYHTNGNPELPYVNLQGVSTCYNLFENVDISTYTNVFDAIGQYGTQSARMKSQSWNDYGEKVDTYGDLATSTDKMNSKDYCRGINGTFRFDQTVIPSQFISNLNRIINKAKQSGAKIVFSYPPHNKNNVEKDSLNDNAYNSYNQWISQTVNCTLISDVRNYLYGGEYFDNTDYHLNSHGRKLHTKQLATDIINANIGVK